MRPSCSEIDDLLRREKDARASGRLADWPYSAEEKPPEDKNTERKRSSFSFFEAGSHIT